MERVLRFLYVWISPQNSEFGHPHSGALSLFFFLEKTPEFEPCLAFVKLDIYKYVLLTFLYHPYRFQYSQKNCFRNRFSLPNRIQGFVA